MLADSKQKNESLSQAYTVLHDEYIKLRSAHARSQQQQSRHTLAVPFEQRIPHPAAMGVSVCNPGVSVMDASMFGYPDLASYTI